MDGISLLRAALGRDPQLAAVVMTAESTIATALEAMQVGALDYVLKPFKLSWILTVISRALSVRALHLENAALEQRVREHTAALESAGRELEMFSYTISHDLRTPLRAIQGFAKVLMEDFAPQLCADGQQLLARVSSNAVRMSQLIDDLLRFGQLSRQPLCLERVRIRELVQEVLEELRTADPERLIDVQLADLPDCIGDRPLLRQVFLNLLSNAFKYSRRREDACVQVGCALRDGASIYCVRDNGAGFDMRRADQLEGTGIGLSTVQRIVQRHGGRIWAESELGKGAAFHFTLSG
jgi:hypothetical protein